MNPNPLDRSGVALPVFPPAALSFSLLFGTRRSITGQLRDISEGGFRAVHTGLVLRSGDQIEFQAAAQHGIAKVVWTRASGLERESGFRIIQITPDADQANDKLT